MPKGGTIFHHDLLRRPQGGKNYNIMGVAKAALEAAVRYLAAGIRPEGNSRARDISRAAGVSRAASGIPEFDALLDKARAKAPARSLVSIDDVGVATAFLAHDARVLSDGRNA